VWQGRTARGGVQGGKSEIKFVFFFVLPLGVEGEEALAGGEFVELEDLGRI
jgi:hypothetical protein